MVGVENSVDRGFINSVRARTASLLFNAADRLDPEPKLKAAYSVLSVPQPGEIAKIRSFEEIKKAGKLLGFKVASRGNGSFSETTATVPLPYNQQQLYYDYTWDASGRIKRIARRELQYSREPGFVEEYFYDRFGRLERYKRQHVARNDVHKVEHIQYNYENSLTLQYEAFDLLSK